MIDRDEFRTDCIGIEVHHANTWWCRARGLIGRPRPGRGAGMYFPRTFAVHGIGMFRALDVLFVDRNNHVLSCRRLLPFGMCFCWSASAVLEMRAGEIARLGIRPGDRLRLMRTENMFVDVS